MSAAKIRPPILQSSPIVQPLAVDETTAAAMLGISPRTLWELRRRGELPHFKLGKLVRFSVDDIRRFIDLKREQTRLGETDKPTGTSDA